MKPVDVNIKMIEGGIKPKKAHPSDGGYDVFVRKVEGLPGDRVRLFLGFSCTFSPEYRLRISPRSSFTKKLGWVLQNSPIMGDAEYTGEYSLVFHRLETHSGEKTPLFNTPYVVGDRCGQMYFEHNIDVNFNEVDELTQTERGDGGFGSTGD